MPKSDKNNQLSTDLADLNSVFPEVHTVKVGDREVEVSPFKFRTLLKALTHVNNILGDVAYLDQYTIMTALLRGIAQHPDDVIGILKLSTGISEEKFYDDLNEVEGVNLILATWEVNKDFFSRNLGDKLKNLFGLPEEDQTPEE